MLDANFATLWEALTDAIGDHAAIVQGQRRLSWIAFEQRAARVARALADHGVGPGDRVALIARNCPEFFEVLFAAFKLSAAPVAFNYRFRTEEFSEVLEDSGSKVAFVHAAFAPEVEPLRERLAWIGIGDGAAPPSWMTPYETCVERPPAPRIERSGDDLFIQYTGGTTGRPKGVVWRHADIAATASFAAYLPLGIAPPDTLERVVEIARQQYESGRVATYLPCTPLMHGAALYGAFSYMQVAGRVVLLEGTQFDGDEFCRTVARERVTNTVIVGDTIAQKILDALDASKEAGAPHDLSSLSMLTSSGLTFSADCKRRLQAHASHLTLLDAVGSSEGGPVGLSLTPPGADPGETAHFIATPQTVLLDEETGRILPRGTGEIGVLAFTGSIPSGYWRDEKKTRETFRTIDGTRYAVPGDYARIDADGRLLLLGRGNTCINTGGEKVFPEEVERVLRDHPSVADCIVVGVPDRTYGSAITAVVSPTPGARPTLDALAIHAKSQLAGYKQPRHLVLVDEVRRTAAGKQDYRWARETAEQAVRGSVA
jgi:fatty-acyl-CoA synthase